jgi:hypothetical protein
VSVGAAGAGDAFERFPSAGERATVPDRELLWAASVSERMLGSGAPRPWERTYFGDDDRDEADRDEADRDADGDRDADDPEAGGRQPRDQDKRDWSARRRPVDESGPEVTHPEPAQPQQQAQPTQAREQQAQAQPHATPAPVPQQPEQEVLGLALGARDPALAAAVLRLLAEQGADRARIATLQAALRAVLDHLERIGEGTTPTAIVVRQVLAP